MRKPLTQVELDATRCATPGCKDDHGPLFFHGRCHPSAATVTSYERGVLTVACAECKRFIAAVEVAKGPVQ